MPIHRDHWNCIPVWQCRTRPPPLQEPHPSAHLYLPWLRSWRYLLLRIELAPTCSNESPRPAIPCPAAQRVGSRGYLLRMRALLSPLVHVSVKDAPTVAGQDGLTCSAERRRLGRAGAETFRTDSSSPSLAKIAASFPSMKCTGVERFRHELHLSIPSSIEVDLETSEHSTLDCMKPGNSVASPTVGRSIGDCCFPAHSGNRSQFGELPVYPNGTRRTHGQMRAQQPPKLKLIFVHNRRTNLPWEP